MTVMPYSNKRSLCDADSSGAARRWWSRMLRLHPFRLPPRMRSGIILKSINFDLAIPTMKVGIVKKVVLEIQLLFVRPSVADMPISSVPVGAYGLNIAPLFPAAAQAAASILTRREGAH